MTDTPRHDTPRHDTPRHDTPRPEMARPEMARPEMATPELAGPELAGPELAGPGAPGADWPLAVRPLVAGRRAPLSGRARSIVVFLHGYGADGADLLGLADPLAEHLPDTLFLAPDAPDPCIGNPFGRQWFPIPWLDGSSQAAAAEGLAASARDLDAWLDAVLDASGLPAAALALVGFSQGTMMALHVAPRRPAALAGIVGFSGRLVAPERLAADLRTRPPVLLLHGDQDPVVPFAEMEAASRALAGAGFAPRSHVMRGTAHGIAPDGLGAALSFLRSCLPG